jgi:putative tryptophan/tyrosine transport system substrate-binding protein
MRRRQFITLLAGGASWPLAARAQQTIYKIGFLGVERLADYANEIAAFQTGLERTAVIADRKVAIEFRWAEGQYSRLNDLAIELLSSYVNVIFCNDAASAQSAKSIAEGIPIIFVTAVDPVASGIVATMRPEANVTGVSYASASEARTRLQLLRELLPMAASVAVLQNPNSPAADAELADLRAAAEKSGFSLNVVLASNSGEIAQAFALFGQEQSEVLIVLTDLVFISERHQIVGLAAQYRIPAIYGQEFFTRAGGLMSYGASPRTAYREAGDYVGQILNGAVPADLPILLPINFELLINLKVANSIGLNIPDQFLFRAEEVIK